jgi:uncharacterized membrane protein YfhO
MFLIIIKSRANRSHKQIELYAQERYQSSKRTGNKDIEKNVSNTSNKQSISLSPSSSNDSSFEYNFSGYSMFSSVLRVLMILLLNIIPLVIVCFHQFFEFFVYRRKRGRRGKPAKGN